MAAATAPEMRARALFDPLGPTYDRVARVLSLGQDPRWRRVLVSQVDVRPGHTALDVATGTGAVAIELARRRGCRVVGVDQSPGMLAEGRRRIDEAGLSGRIELVEAGAARLPFDDASFDAVTFTYLLRYVEPEPTLRELVRVARAGATIAMLEFGLPRGLARAAWEIYVRAILPLAGRILGPAWAEVGDFLGRSIRDFHSAWPEERLLALWRDAGVAGPRLHRLSLGGGIVVSGRRA